MQEVLHFISGAWLQYKALVCFFWPSPPWGVQLCLEGPSSPAPLFLHTSAKQGEGAEPLGFSFLLESKQFGFRCISGLFFQTKLYYFFSESELSTIISRLLCPAGICLLRQNWLSHPLRLGAPRNN